MFKEIFSLLVALVSQPRKTWALLAKQSDQEDAYLSRFLYPIIGIATLASFFSLLFISDTGFSLEIALKKGIVCFVSFFGALYMASYLFRVISDGLFQIEFDKTISLRFIAYSVSLLYVLEIILVLFPEFFIVRILMLYIVYVIWEGCEIFLGIGDKMQMKIVLLASILTLGSPYFIKFILCILMPGLNV